METGLLRPTTVARWVPELFLGLVLWPDQTMRKSSAAHLACPWEP